MFTGGGRTEAYDTRATRFSLAPILKKHKADVYLAGHEHSLQHITTDGHLHHFISGSASEKTSAILIPGSQFAASEYGFLAFSILTQVLIVQAVDYKGKIIYQTSIKK